MVRLIHGCTVKLNDFDGIVVFIGFSTSFFRAAAQVGMNVTDLQVTNILGITGPTTAGQLAELMGLTKGAITGMIDRLEKAGLVRRERDAQ